jgi:hypothetical protein
LVVEFFQTEILLYKQHASVTEASSGTNQAFVCAMLERPEFECLDIAAATTLSGIWNPVYTNSNDAALSASPLISTNFMVNAVDGSMLTHNTTLRYGMNSTCDGKIVGDGVVNGLDLFVFGASQFRLGPYSNIGDALSDVETTQGRQDTRLRCGEGYSRLDWQNRIAWDACFSTADESEYLQQEAQPGRRLSAIEAPRRSIVGFELAHNAPSPPYPVQDLGARLFLWASASPLGRWYIINIPNIVIVAEIFVRGTESALETPLNNEPAPKFNSMEVPLDANKFDVRFVRHLERAGAENKNCTIIQSSGSQLGILNKGMVSVSQRLLLGDEHTKLCAFDLVLWVPTSAREPRSPDCPLQIAKGSVAMDGVAGSVQFSDECASNDLFYEFNHSNSNDATDTNTGPRIHVFLAVSGVVFVACGIALSNVAILTKRTHSEHGTSMGNAKLVASTIVSPAMYMKL